MDYGFELVSPPSETILRRVSDLKIDIKKFRDTLELSVTEFGNLIHDQLKINNKLAYNLSIILGGSELFWINRYNDYFEELDESNMRVYEEYRETIDNLCSSRKTSLNNLLNDFQYSSFEHLILDYFENPKILYSRTQRFEPSPISLANWIRECDKEAENYIFNGSVNVFSKELLELELPNILSHTKVNNVQKITDKLKEICFNCGVILLFKSSKSGFGISGFTKKILKNYRLVVVTDRYKNNAAFWFTLLHELSHCILHDLRFPLIHYSDNEFQLASLKDSNVYEEDEANKYVESLLFPDLIIAQIRKCNSYSEIMNLAVTYNISSALIVAQIHKEKLAPYSWYRKVYREVKF